MLFIGFQARSPQIAAASRLVSLNWAYTLQLWMVADGVVLAVSYASVDAATALALYRMSQRQWFPAPLVFLHAFLALYNLYTAFLDPNNYWIVLALNRIFEIEIFYVAGCGLYRITAMRRPGVKAPE